MIFQCTKLHLFIQVQRFVSCLHKTKYETVNSPPSSLFFSFTKLVLIKIVLPLKIYQHTKSHGPTLNGESFASTSEVQPSTILEHMKLRS
jgi:hypothetical protein